MSISIFLEIFYKLIYIPIFLSIIISCIVLFQLIIYTIKKAENEKLKLENEQLNNTLSMNQKRTNKFTQHM